METQEQNMYDQLAQKMMFSGIDSVSTTLSNMGLEYRKDKSVEDVRKALVKGLKAGQGKVESELSCVSLYLKQVLKQTQKTSSATST